MTGTGNPTTTAMDLSAGMGTGTGTGPGTTDRGGLRTTSLSRRVLLFSLGVLLVVLVVAGVLADILLGAQLRADASARLNARVAEAQAALDSGAQAREIVAAAQGDGITASLVAASGAIVGNADLTPSPPVPAGPTPPDPAARPGPAANLQQLSRELSDGSVLTVAVDTAAIDDVRTQLRTVLIPTLSAALLVAGILLWWATRTALRPLDRMTTLARSITRGQRGRRLNPTRDDTELGRTAAAFDAMLDELEGAEAAANTSAARTRQFTDDAAHELRTPIAGIQAASEALLGLGSRLDPAQRDQMQLLVVREARRAGRLVEELLSLATLDAGVQLSVEPVELSSLLRARVSESVLIAPDVEIYVHATPSEFTADAFRLTQLIDILLDNARRHGRRPGSVRCDLVTTADTVELSVQDDGPGVPPPDRERVFDRLVRLDSSRTRPGSEGGTAVAVDGSGLGLSIARGIATAHHGTVICTDPTPGWTGARFVVRLPVPPPTVRR